MDLTISNEKIATVRDLQTKVSSLLATVKDGGFYRIIRNKETIGFLISQDYMEYVEELQEDLNCLKSKFLAQKVAKARKDKKRVSLEEIL
ncbi:hypothetical protein KJ840_05265 [Patescibacteria group bacterium]|nr:hypothetical protein [Patescibacteria group bacterium]